MSNLPFEAAHERVCKLVKQFQDGSDTYLSADYKEFAARQDFIDPLFIALGWDVLHQTQIDPLQQEVKAEKSVIMAEGRKSADYAFSVAPAFGRTRFFCEAKKPSKVLKNADDCFQAIRYGWNGNTPLAVLTDFEEVFVMDCRAKPELASATARILQKWHYTDFLDREKFGAFYSLFGRDAVAGGSLERYVEHLKSLPASESRQMRLLGSAAQAVDVDFLNQLQEWRGELAQSFKRARPSLDAAALTETTQRALDRLVFVRFLEDKLIETEDRVSQWIAGDAWRNFRAAARELDRKYNGVLWKPHPILDDPSFDMRDAVWSKICFRISNKETPYLFNLIPIPILGSIYERFLGNEIEITGGKIEVAPKPEVRKAGGVYYTPEYIVQYIVKHTVEVQLESKTPTQVAKMRFADIACGSGSFLLGVYDSLLRWHTTYYAANPRDAKRDGCIEDDGVARLSLKQRRTILENNIWGADIDAQAVEVSKLSLYLKLLEDETANSARQFQLDFGERVLPDLDKNIVCGNSLVTFDILDGNNLSEEEEAKINPMDWNVTFSQILRGKGFDAILGNPPWVDIKGLDPIQVRYFFSKYKTVENRMNIYAVFMQKAMELVKPNGCLGYITPHSFLMQSSYNKLRQYLLQYQVDSIIRTPDKIFVGVTAETAISIYKKVSPYKTTHTVIFSPHKVITSLSETDAENVLDVEQQIWSSGTTNNMNLYHDADTQNIEKKLEERGVPLEKMCAFSLGLTPYDKYKGHTQEQIKQKAFHADYKVNKEYQPLLDGGDISRYSVRWSGDKYIRYGSWLGAPRERRFFTQPRIVVRQIISGNPPRIYAGFTSEELYNTQVGFNLLPLADVKESLFYILALLNSRLMTWYHSQKHLDQGKVVFQKILIQDAKKFPIRSIDFASKSDVSLYHSVVSIVEQMLTAKQENLSMDTEAQLRRATAKIASLDRRIDELVYELYGLTDEEVALVEGH